MRLRSFFQVLVIGLTAFSCGSPEEKSVQDENLYMVELLAEKHAIVKPEEITFYFNTKRAEVLDSIRKQKRNNFDDYISFTYWYLRETLNSGATEKCIEEIMQFKDELKSNNRTLDEQWDYFFQRLLAVSYIRMGEQVNCLVNHTASSCILPVSGSGIHTNKAGSQAAIDIIEGLIDDYPEDLELIWLLNICYQTIGGYPDDVPKSYLIPEKSFTNQSTIDFKQFQDVAPHLGVATKGIAGGSIVEDFNNDGFLDLVATSSGTLLEDQMRLYINDGKGGFIDKTIESGLAGLVGGLNCVQTDYNNDGWVDIFVMRGGWFDKWGKHPNSLLRNNGDGTFTDVTKASGLLSFNPTQTVAWADFNNDGWLDLFIGNESSAPPGRRRAFASKIHPAEFYVNQKDGTFKNIAEEKGLDFKMMIKGVSTIDINNDNLPDLYISVNNGPNKVLVNEGDFNFEDVTRSLRMDQPFSSFPVAVFDYDNDGFEDLLVAGYISSSKSLAHETAYEFLGNEPKAALPILYKNKGDGSFEDVTNAVNLNHTIYAMGCNFGDLDNDGFIDIYFGTGNPDFESIVPNRMFRNVEGEYFEEVTFSGGFSNIQKGHGISWGDLDNDGDEDIYITMGGAHEGDIYQNQLMLNPFESNNWINIQLTGEESNRKAIGAKVHLVTSLGQHIYRKVSSGASFGANSYDLEIGIGKADKIDLMEVTWPKTGAVQRFESIEPNQHIELIESKQEIRKRAIQQITFKTQMAANQDMNHE